MQPAIGTPAQFQAVRDGLRVAAYLEETFRSRYGLDGIHAFKSRLQGRPGPDRPEDAFELLVRLFLDAESVPREETRRLLPAGLGDALDALGLLLPHPAAPEERCASVILYPVSGVWVISDRIRPPDGDPAELPEDVVFPAMTPQTARFLRALPEQPCEAMLDLCAGTGIAALRGASRFARHAWAADVTGRSTHFARFNALLNGLENVTAVQGDLYEAVAGLTFDLIVAHPPYVPSLQPTQIFKDGGADGEQITRRILSGLAGYLRPGGRLYCVAMGSDRKGKRLETRVREMLGTHHVEFDVLVAAREVFEPVDYYFKLALEGRERLADLPRRHAIFQQLEIEYLVTGAIVVTRRTADRPAYTARRQLTGDFPAATIERALALEAWEADPATTAGLWDRRPRAAEGVQLRVINRLSDGRWVTADCALETGSPFFQRARCPAWAGVLVAGSNGERSFQDLFDELVRAGVLQQENGADFLAFVRTLVGAGFLTL